MPPERKSSEEACEEIGKRRVLFPLCASSQKLSANGGLSSPRPSASSLRLRYLRAVDGFRSERSLGSRVEPPPPPPASHRPSILPSISSRILPGCSNAFFTALCSSSSRVHRRLLREENRRPNSRKPSSLRGRFANLCEGSVAEGEPGVRTGKAKKSRSVR